MASPGKLLRRVLSEERGEWWPQEEAEEEEARETPGRDSYRNHGTRVLYGTRLAGAATAPRISQPFSVRSCSGPGDNADYLKLDSCRLRGHYQTPHPGKRQVVEGESREERVRGERE